MSEITKGDSEYHRIQNVPSSDDFRKQRENTHMSIHDRERGVTGVTVVIKGNSAYFKRENTNRVISYLPGAQLKDSEQEEEVVKIEGVNDENGKRNLVERYFSKMEEGSLRASIFALINVALGAGILSLPYVLKQTGYVLGTILIMCGGATSFASNVCLTKAHAETNVNSYAELVNTAMGKMSSKLLELVTVFHGYGVTVSYMVILGTNFQQLLFTFFIDKETADQFYVWALIILGEYICLLPLVCRRSINELRYVNFLGVFAALYPAILVCILAPVFIQNEFYPKVYHAAKFNLNIVTSFSVCLFAFTCQIVVIPVKLELKNPTEVRLIKIFRRCAVCEGIIYMAAAIMGYTICGENTPDLITQIEPISSSWLLYKVLMNAAVILVVINMYVSVPMQQVPVRDMIIRFLKLDKENNLVLYPASFLFLSAAAMTALVLTNIISILSILGGFCSCFVVVFFPGMSYGLICLKTSKAWGIGILAVTLSITAVGLTSCLLVALETLKVITLD